MLSKLYYIITVSLVALLAPASVETPRQEPAPVSIDQPAAATATPLADDRAPRLGLRDGVPLLATPAGTLGPWAHATPCAPWIDAAGVMYCMTPPPMPEMEGYPAP